MLRFSSEVQLRKTPSLKRFSEYREIVTDLRLVQPSNTNESIEEIELGISIDSSLVHP